MTEKENTGRPWMSNNGVMLLLVAMRTLIGWHFLYEGVSKLFNPQWTAKGFLFSSDWLFSSLFHSIAENLQILALVNQLNIWGLILIGLSLMLGIGSRIASVAGVVLLMLYYFAQPPFVFSTMPAEGNYLIINKNLIEAFALLVLVFVPTDRFIGLGKFLRWKKTLQAQAKTDKENTPAEKTENKSLKRREMLKGLATLPFMGAFVYALMQKHGWESFEVKNLKQAAAEPDAVSGATLKRFKFTDIDQLKGTLPKGEIKKLELSRIILGGNLVGGWAHARDLIYVSKLVKAYHTRDKIYETFLLAEKAGINSFLTNPQLCKIINDYWNRNIGNIKFISDCAGKTLIDGVKTSIDSGASACYIQGGIADRLVKRGEFDELDKALQHIQDNGLPAGIGGHKLETIKTCVKRGYNPDFWMKTLHPTDYWSAKAEEKHDNIWCTQPRETVDFMEKLDQPWIAFKTLAAGAVHPKKGFRYAFENGADFICVGMYDFQIVENANLARDVLNSNLNRKRSWKA